MSKTNGSWDTIKMFVWRNRLKIVDLGLVSVTLAIATLYAFEVDIFIGEGRSSPRAETIELDELLLLSVFVMGGVLFYVWRRAADLRREADRRKAAEQEVMTLALQDPLTGLPNRRQFDEALRTAVGRAPTAPEAHALLMLDLNGFKAVNDRFGHPIGDQVLVHVGARLLRAVRDGDLVARLGGDEFGVIARNVAGADGAANIALRIIECLRQPVTVSGVPHPVGTAIGIALTPHDAVVPDELVRKADVALYRAKAERVSAMRFFEPAMDARLQERERLESALADAMANGGFSIRFQPRVANDGRIVAFEALPTWVQTESQDLAPEHFYPIAEEAAALPALTRLLLTQACAPTHAWPKAVRLSFALPSSLLASPTFGLTILAVLAETRLSPNRLDLEVDEGAMIRDVDTAIAMLEPLRQAGVSVIASRFGTGYANLQNFRKLQLDGVKIDRSFIEAMADDRSAAVMIKALISVGQGLDLEVIADGVSTPRQRAALQAQGCDQIQGDFSGGPVTAEETALMVAPTNRRHRRAG